MTSPALLLSQDLLAGSQVLGAARALGRDARQIQTAAQLLEQAPSAGLVLIDLNSSGLQLAELIPALRAANSAVRIIAFGPHVHTGLLAAARDAGCDEVLTRGQFIGQVSKIVS
jgi:DNA-binding NarL/FixJ family response regulator